MNIPSNTFTFLKQIKKNNNKEWFAKHKIDYTIARDNIEAVASYISSELATAQPAIKNITPDYKIFRIYKDVRFSKNKTPYKTNLGAIMGNHGINEIASFYLHLEPDNCFIGGGLYCPTPVRLSKVRQLISSHLDEFRDIISRKPFSTYYKLEGSTLKTVPRGYTKDHPAAEYLRYKDFLGMYKLTDNEVQEKSFAKKAVRILKALTPLINFLNE